MKAARWAALAGALALAACGGGKTDTPPETADLRIGGSSTVYPISAEAARRYRRSARGASIAVNFGGTTAGFRAFCAGQTHITGASRPIDREEMQACADNGVQYIELPIAFDALAIVVHEDNDWATDISADELKRLWEPAAEGHITRWNQVRDGWPDEAIVLFGRGKDSGTFDYFTSVIVGERRAVRGDYTGSEDIDFLVDSIAGEPNALGFFGVGGYFPNWERLNALALRNGDQAAHPTADNVRSSRYRPLARPLFFYVNAADVHNVPHLRSFVTRTLDGMHNWVALTGYVPLSEGYYVLARERFAQGVTGTRFNGALQIGVSADDLF